MKNPGSSSQKIGKKYLEISTLNCIADNMILLKRDETNYMYTGTLRMYFV